MLDSFISIREDQMNLTVLFWLKYLSVLQDVLIASGPSDNWNIAHKEESEGSLTKRAGNNGVKLHGICMERMCKLKLQLICWPSGNKGWCSHTISATSGLSFENRAPACPPRTSTEMSSNPSGRPSLHPWSWAANPLCSFHSDWSPPTIWLWTESTLCWIVQCCDFVAVICNLMLRHSEFS